MGDSNAKCLPPQILSCFKISRIRLLASQCSKKLTNPMTLTEYSLFPRSTSSTSTKFTTSGGKCNIFLTRTRTKIPIRMHQNTPFQVKNSFFSREGACSSHQTPFPVGPSPQTPSLAPTKDSGSAPASPVFYPDLRHWPR